MVSGRMGAVEHIKLILVISGGRGGWYRHLMHRKLERDGGRKESGECI